MVEGRVEAANDTGIKIDGKWVNRSRFQPVTLPDAGATVRVDVDGKGYIKALEVLDQSAQPAAGARQQTITRLAVLKAAATFAASREEAKSSDVLAIAQRWLAWVEESVHNS